MSALFSMACVLDTSKLNAALHEAMRWSSRTPEKCVNSCAMAVLRSVKKKTSFVPIERIDAELGMAVVLQQKKRGDGFLKSARTRRYAGGKMGTIVKTVPLTVLILLARANRAGLNRGRGDGKTSNYNKITNLRWQTDKMPSKDEMPGVIHRMIAARHSASKFLISGWVAAERQMRGAEFGEPPVIDADTGKPIEVDLGRATPAQGGNPVAICIIENLVGMGAGKNAENYNQALMRHGLAPLQEAIDEEADKQLRHVFEKLFRTDLTPKWNAMVG